MFFISALIYIILSLYLLIYRNKNFYTYIVPLTIVWYAFLIYLKTKGL